MRIDDAYSLQRRKTVPSGFVKWFVRDKTTGAVVLDYESPNTITYLATKVMAHSIAGLPGYKVTHIYGEHADPGVSGYIDGSLNGLASARTDTVDIMRTAPRTTTDAESAVLTTNFTTTTELGVPPFTVPTTDYDLNIATFTAAFTATSLDGEIFVGAGLITKIGTSEILFAHQYRPALTKLPGYDILVAWSVRYL